MSLGLEIADLTLEDLARVDIPPRGYPSGALERLSRRHHLLAKYLGKGFTANQAAHLTGYSLNMVYSLQQDPTFRDLVAFYEEEHDETVLEILRAKLEGLSMEAMDELLTRFEDPALRAKISIAQLESLAKTGLDRLGLGVSIKQETNVNVSIATRLEAARKRLAEPKVIDHE